MATEKFAPTIDKVGEVRRLSDSQDGDLFESVYFPENRLGSDTAYGGFGLAVAVRSAFETVDNSAFSLYSVLGNFLGPSTSQQKLRVKVRKIRDTRSFVTRFLEVSQLTFKSTDKSQDGNTQETTKERLVMTLTVDFHRPEEALLTSYPKPQPRSYAPLEQAQSESDLADTWLKRGAPKPIVNRVLGLFRLTEKFFDRRLTPGGVMAQNMYGAVGNLLKTNQDHLPLTERSSADYMHIKGSLNSVAEHMAAFTFYADSGLSFLGLVHSSTPFSEASIYATLEFAHRFHVSDIRFDEWIYREVRLTSAAEGRTCGEARYWDQRGRLLCTTSQVCILRPANVKAKV